MATPKNPPAEDAPAEKQRAVDPPRVEPVVEDERSSQGGVERVQVTGSGMVEAPSGATFALAPGTELKVLSSDASWLREQGYVADNTES